ncbi:MAG: hypothetical protein JRI23_12360, partial [Deltaproteobacteria bacterium]|nr:hypothetical protein [Deltaproteobacteria bacterium]MBW2532505.1 hypothetical protein [Deltaproteobacteria bacterium]
MSQFGQYEVIRSLAGERTEAHLARRTAGAEGQEYVLIPLDVTGDDAHRIADELERCRSLDDPAIASVVEVFGHRGRPVLVYDSSPGTNVERLRAHLAKSGDKLDPTIVLHVGRLLFEALAASHEAPGADGSPAAIVHGQLGPHQVLLSWRGAVALFGCGLYRLHRAVEVLHGVPDAMLPFVAPENRGGSDPTERANVFSAAAILHALLAGKAPAAEALTLEPVARLWPEVPEEVGKALDRALAPKPDRRTVTAREIATLLDRTAPATGEQRLVELLETYRELEHVDAGFMPAECVPPLLQAGLSEPPTGPDAAQVFVPRLSDEEAGRGSARLRGKGIYAIVGDDAPSEVAGRRAGARGRVGGKPKSGKAKPKHTFPGTGASAWNAAARAGDDGEVPPDRDTLRGAGGPGRPAETTDDDVSAQEERRKAKQRKGTLVGNFGAKKTEGTQAGIGATMPR